MFLKRNLYRSPEDSGGAPPAPPTPPAPPAAPTPPAPPPEGGGTPPAPPAPTPPAPPAPPASKWSETWREDMAGTLADDASEEDKVEHEKRLATLKRLNSPADAAKKIREQEKYIASGAHKKPLAKNATPEQIAAWRTENGIPDAPDKYDHGLKLDELAPMSAKFISVMTAKAHAANASPEAVKAIASAIPEFERAMAAEVEARNSAAKSEGIETLRAEWGAEYKPNVDGVMSWINSLDSTVSEALINSRDADGVQLLNNPDVMRAFAKHSRELGYVGATVVPSGGDLGKGIDDELDGLKKEMGKDIEAWRKNSKGQARYMELMESKQRMSARK